MKIANVMISRVMGGIEQVFLNYNTVFDALGYEVISIVDNKNALPEELKTPVLKIRFQMEIFLN